MMEVRSLSKSFGGIVVADNIDLLMRKGRVLGLIGPNGAGKTSLFNLISGVFPADAGTITLDGKPLDRLALHQRARLGLSRTWQHVRLFPSLSVIDNLIIAARDYPGERLTSVLLTPGKVRTAALSAREKARETLERMGLGNTAEKSVGDLPYGPQKLVGGARALMNDARCPLLHEPLAGAAGRTSRAGARVVRPAACSGA